MESYSASTIYLCYEDAATKRVTRIFVGEDRVYAAGVKVTYQIDNGYSLERTVPDREDAIAAAPPAALEGYIFAGWRQDSSAEKKVLSEFIISSEEPVTLYAVFKKQMTIGLMERIGKGRARMEELEQSRHEAQMELERMQEMADPEGITDEELAGLSMLETFDVDRLKALIEKVAVYGEDAIEIVWKVKNPFGSEVSV